MRSRLSIYGNLVRLWLATFGCAVPCELVVQNVLVVQNNA
jgi:hypothetical protein